MHSKGEYILFMDDDNYAKPHEISTFVRAMRTSGADVLTSFVDFFWGEERPDLTSERPSYMFLGGSADVGAFKNCFGDANCFVRRSSFDAIGGYTEDYGIGFEDWEMYANASLRGFKARAQPLVTYVWSGGLRSAGRQSLLHSHHCFVLSSPPPPERPPTPPQTAGNSSL